jgi:hypothetical protein
MLYIDEQDRQKTQTTLADLVASSLAPDTSTGARPVVSPLDAATVAASDPVINPRIQEVLERHACP